MWLCNDCNRRFYGYNILTYYCCPHCQSNETRDLNAE